MDKFLDRQEFFQKNVDAKLAVFDSLAQEFMKYMIPIYAQNSLDKLDWIIREELKNIDSTNVLTSFLFSRMNIFQVQLIQMQNLIFQQQSQIQQLQVQLQKNQNPFQLNIGNF